MHALYAVERSTSRALTLISRKPHLSFERRAIHGQDIISLPDITKECFLKKIQHINRRQSWPRRQAKKNISQIEHNVEII